MKKIKLSAGVLCCSMLFAFTTPVQAQNKQLTQFEEKQKQWVGRPAPQFKLQDQKQNWHDLSQYKGQWVVLYFYPKDD